MHRAHAGALPLQQPADVHQAGAVAGDEHLGAGVAHVPDLVAPIATEVSAFFTAKVPPKPQHSSAAGRSTSVSPRTWESRV